MHLLLPVWDGHSHPSLLTLVLILRLILILTGKGTAQSRAAHPPPNWNPASAAEGRHLLLSDVIPNRAESPVRNLLFLCHPEEAESHAKRATPDEGPMQLVSTCPTVAPRLCG